MGDSEKDKELLENINRMLEGREDEITGEPDEDSRSALDFARKFASMGQKPSDEFRDSLKARIVQQLAEQEDMNEPQDPELAFWGIRRRKKWQGTVAALITVIIIAVILVITLVLND